MRWSALVLALLLAGCTRPPEAEPAEALPPIPDEPHRLVAIAPPTRSIPVSVALADTWIRPQQTIHANASASASSFEWYLATRNPLAELRDPGPFVLAEGATSTLSVRGAGRHAFALDGTPARLNVSIVPGSIAVRLEATIVEEDGALRFAPSEHVGGVGSVVRVTNAAPGFATLRRAESMVPLDGTRASISFEMPAGLELGDYDVVAVARDGAGGVGSASARLVYDNRKPETSQDFGPFVGSFRFPPVPEAQALRHDWESAHPLRSLEISLSFGSSMPAPARLRATLLDADGAPLGAVEREPLTLRDLPAGPYAVVVEHLEGALVEYEVEVHGEWQLVPPTSFFRND